MTTDINPTTKRFHRTSIEAFGPDATQACAVEHYRCYTTYIATWLVRVIFAVAAVGIIWSLS